MKLVWFCTVLTAQIYAGFISKTGGNPTKLLRFSPLWTSVETAPTLVNAQVADRIVCTLKPEVNVWKYWASFEADVAAFCLMLEWSDCRDTQRLLTHRWSEDDCETWLRPKPLPFAPPKMLANRNVAVLLCLRELVIWLAGKRHKHQNISFPYQASFSAWQQRNLHFSCSPVTV